MNEKCIVVIPTHSSYLDICENFIDIFSICWKECKFKIVLAVTGENINFRHSLVEFLYCGKDKSLPDCVYMASQKWKSDYYMVFLGDAFFTKNIDSFVIEEFLEELRSNNIDYCCLKPKKTFHVNYIGRFIRKIYKNDRYNFSFISFVASNKFVNDEFGKISVSDLEFENKYLDSAISNCEEKFYDNCCIITDNLMGILPSIEKGKWDRFSLKKLKKMYPHIWFAEREHTSFFESCIIYQYNSIGWLLPYKIRVIAKKILKIFCSKMIVTKS